MVCDADRGEHQALAGVGDSSGDPGRQDDVRGEVVNVAIVVGDVAQRSDQQPDATPPEWLTIDGEPPQAWRLGRPWPFHHPRQAEDPIGEAVDGGRDDGFHDLRYAYRLRRFPLVALRALCNPVAYFRLGVRVREAPGRQAGCRRDSPRSPLCATTGGLSAFRWLKRSRR